MVKKIIVGVLLLVLIAGVSIGIKFTRDMSTYRAAMSSIQINEIDVSKVDDGEYVGEYDATIISAKVKVQVKNHEIVGIELIEHNNGRGETAETIIDTIMQEQSVKVDTISGATNSSKTILKAVDDALNN